MYNFFLEERNQKKNSVTNYPIDATFTQGIMEGSKGEYPGYLIEIRDRHVLWAEGVLSPSKKKKKGAIAIVTSHGAARVSANG